MRKLTCLLVCVLLAVARTATADTLTLGFYGITHNNAANESIGEAQLSVDVSNEDVNGKALDDWEVAFIFRNVGPQASSITDVYFDDGTLLGISSILGSGGVAFNRLAKPGELPGAQNLVPAFVTTAGFSADSDKPVQWNGVNPGEWLQIIFDLQSQQTYQDTVDALLHPTAKSDLRIGIHVQGFASGSSESFVNEVPAPSSMVALVSMGLVGLFHLRRRS
jgi:hypothetical protein